MVRRRLDERMVAIARLEGTDEALEGVYLAARDADGRPCRGPGAVVAPPHPLYGGSMESPLVNELAHACARVGISTLRFNWRGVGASSGVATGDAAAADADYAAAAAHLADTLSGPFVACGYSFGAVAALRVGQKLPGFERLVLVAPPPALLAPDALAALDRPALVVVGARDALAPPDELVARLEKAPRARLVTVSEADHFFLRGLAEVGRLVAEWLERG